MGSGDYFNFGSEKPVFGNGSVLSESGMMNTGAYFILRPRSRRIGKKGIIVKKCGFLINFLS